MAYTASENLVGSWGTHDPLSFATTSVDYLAYSSQSKTSVNPDFHITLEAGASVNNA
jgi:hypothetical protein